MYDINEHVWPHSCVLYVLYFSYVVEPQEQKLRTSQVKNNLKQTSRTEITIDGQERKQWLDNTRPSYKNQSKISNKKTKC